MTASFNPTASQWSTMRRAAMPMFAASDIIQGAAVCIASNGAVTGGWDVIMCASSSNKPIGVARDYAIAGNPVAVYDDGNIVRANVGGNGVGASFGQQDFVGVVGTSSMVHPQSGVTVTFGVFGKVTANASAVGVGPAIWAVGVSYEAAFPGDFSAFRVEPRTLSGVVSQ